MENAEINNIIKIVGLQYKKSYDDAESLKTLRYGKIMIMTDQVSLKIIACLQFMSRDCFMYVFMHKYMHKFLQFISRDWFMYVFMHVYMHACWTWGKCFTAELYP